MPYKNKEDRKYGLRAWTTEQEMKWLFSIGSNIDKESCHTPFSRFQLLRSYINTADKRDNWHGIDKKKCVTYATRLLLAEGSPYAV